VDRVLTIIGLRFKLLARTVLGQGGTANLLGSIGLVVLGGLFALGLAIGFGIMVHVLAQGGDPQNIRIGFLICFYTFFFFGIVLPLVGGAMDRSFDAAPFLIFPISRLRLFGITLTATLGSPHHLVYLPALVAVLIVGVLFSGVSIVAGVLLVLLVFLTYLAWSNFFSLMLVSMMRGRRAREIFAILALGLVILVSLTPSLLEGDSESIRKAIPRLTAALKTVMSLSRGLPPSLAADGLTALHETDSALSGILGLLAWNGAGILLGYFVFSRYYLGDRQIRIAGRKRKKARVISPGRSGGLFSFDHRLFSALPRQVCAIAAKDLHYMLRSVVGRFNLFIVPIFVLILVLVVREIIKEPVLGIDPERALLFGMLFYALLFSSNFVNNTFAWEGEGIKAYFMSPVTLKAVLFGKNLAVWIYNGLLFSLLMLCWSAGMGLPDPSTFLSALLMYSGAILIFTGFGNFLSILFPVRRDMSKINSSPSPIAVLASFATLAATVLLIGPFLSVPLLLGWNAVQPVLLAALLAGLIGAYAVTLRAASLLLGSRRERIIDALKSSS
jgi:ABC-2 type transport system permease protein